MKFFSVKLASSARRANATYGKRAWSLDALGRQFNYSDKGDKQREQSAYNLIKIVKEARQ